MTKRRLPPRDRRGRFTKVGLPLWVTVAIVLLVMVALAAN